MNATTPPQKKPGFIRSRTIARQRAATAALDGLEARAGLTTPLVDLVLRHMVMGVSWASLPELDILYTNSGFDRIFECPAGYFKSGADLTDQSYVHAGQRAFALESWSNCLHGTGEAIQVPSMEIEIRTQENRIKTVLHAGLILPGEGLAIATFTDITDIRQDQRKLMEYAYQDPLTGLGNRRALDDWWRQESADAGNTMALILVDLNDFKPINDRMGHAAGDELLRALGRRLRRQVRQEDLVCRLGGDEFAVLLKTPAGPDAVEAVCKRIQRGIARPFILRSGQRVEVSAALGAAHYPAQGQTWDALHAVADAALYASKNTRER